METVRYYQRRKLLPLPVAQDSAFRTYPVVLIDRIRFIKRSQELGFSLGEIEALLQLEDGSDRTAIRELAADKLQHIRAKITDLTRIEAALSHLLHECTATGQSQPCPIIAALAGSIAPDQ